MFCFSRYRRKELTLYEDAVGLLSVKKQADSVPVEVIGFRNDRGGSPYLYPIIRRNVDDLSKPKKYPDDPQVKQGSNDPQQHRDPVDPHPDKTSNDLQPMQTSDSLPGHPARLPCAEKPVDVISLSSGSDNNQYDSDSDSENDSDDEEPPPTETTQPTPPQKAAFGDKREANGSEVINIDLTVSDNLPESDQAISQALPPQYDVNADDGKQSASSSSSKSKMATPAEASDVPQKKVGVNIGRISKHLKPSHKQKTLKRKTLKTKAKKTWQVHIKARCIARHAPRLSRRFTVAYRTPFLELKQRLREMFKLSTDVKVSYKDEDRDNVALTNDNELRELFAVSRSNSICPVLVQVYPTFQNKSVGHQC